MKSNESAPVPIVKWPFQLQADIEAPSSPVSWSMFVQRMVASSLTLMLLASCSSLGKPEQQLSNLAPACNQREPALDSGDPPALADGSPSTDWMAWAQAYVRAQWAVVDRDNKRAATADCLDELARSRK